MTGYLTHESNIARLEDMHRAGGRRRGVDHEPAIPAAVPAQVDQAIAIRPVNAADAAAIRRLAILDSAEVPSGDMLVAVVEGTPRAAIDITTGATIADPFERTASIVDLLTLRAARLRTDAGVSPLRRRLRAVLRAA